MQTTVAAVAAGSEVAPRYPNYMQAHPSWCAKLGLTQASASTLHPQLHLHPPPLSFTSILILVGGEGARARP